MGNTPSVVAQTGSRPTPTSDVQEKQEQGIKYEDIHRTSNEIKKMLDDKYGAENWSPRYKLVSSNYKLRSRRLFTY